MAWRTLRIVSSTQLLHFGKIGVNDIEKLIEEINKPSGTVVAAPSSATVTADLSLDESMKVKGDQPKEPAEAIMDAEDATDPAVGPASPASGKRPRADSAMEISQEEAKKQRITE